MKKFLKSLKYLLPFLGSFLATLGGQGVKELRRVVLPIILSIVGAISLQSYWGILMGTVGISFAIGYGIPSYSFGSVVTGKIIIAEIHDEGSALGKFWYNLLNYNHSLADIFTRGSVGILQCMSGLVCPILKENWLMYFIGCAFIMIGQTVFSYRGWGFIPFRGKELLYSDLLNYGCIFIGYFLMLII